MDDKAQHIAGRDIKSPASRKVVSLAEKKIRLNSDLIMCLKEMLQQAESGELVGMAFVAMLTERRYATHVLGECHLNPTFARGMLTVLDDELADQIHGRRR